MKGQLWQECACGNEPVCCNCEKCEAHCRCGQPPKPKIDTSEPEPYRKGIGQGTGSTADGEEGGSVIIEALIFAAWLAAMLVLFGVA